MSNLQTNCVYNYIYNYISKTWIVIENMRQMVDPRYQTP